VSSAPQYKVKGLDLRTFPLRWKVESEKDGYVVNLAEDTCTCNHWLYRLSKNEGSARRCKNINLARERLLDSFITYQKTS
jgi:hypothetical protein